jgi:hypothetical protein
VAPRLPDYEIHQLAGQRSANRGADTFLVTGPPSSAVEVNGESPTMGDGDSLVVTGSGNATAD